MELRLWVLDVTRNSNGFLRWGEEEAEDPTGCRGETEVHSNPTFR